MALQNLHEMIRNLSSYIKVRWANDNFCSQSTLFSLYFYLYLYYSLCIFISDCVLNSRVWKFCVRVGYAWRRILSDYSLLDRYWQLRVDPQRLIRHNRRSTWMGMSCHSPWPLGNLHIKLQQLIPMPSFRNSSLSSRKPSKMSWRIQHNSIRTAHMRSVPAHECC